MSTEQEEKHIIGLKTEIKRQVGIKNFTLKCETATEHHMIAAWKSMQQNGLNHLLPDLIWGFINGYPSRIMKQEHSHLLGVFSQMWLYSRKKDNVMIMMHFTQCGNALGTVKKLGDKPISYHGYFAIKQTQFDLNLDALQDATTIQDLFKPKPLEQQPEYLATLDDEPKIEEPEPKKFKINRKTMKVSQV